MWKESWQKFKSCKKKLEKIKKGEKKTRDKKS